MLLADAQTLAERLLLEHGLIQTGWTFAFDRAKTRGGKCSLRERKITVSKLLVLAQTEAEVRDTLLHEIAHAFAGHAHDKVWRAEAVALGARPDARCAAFAPPSFIGSCPRCGGTMLRHRRDRLWCRCIKSSGLKHLAENALVWRRLDQSANRRS